MADVMTKAQRSRCMSLIKGKDTKPELLLRREVWRLGLRYRTHLNMPGRPDLVFTRKKIAIFVDGCFWHGCPAHGVRPKSNAEFWKKKLRQNRLRDRRTARRLMADGWAVIRIWEHEVEADLTGVVEKVRSAVNSRRFST